MGNKKKGIGVAETTKIEAGVYRHLRTDLTIKRGQGGFWRIYDEAGSKVVVNKAFEAKYDANIYLRDHTPNQREQAEPKPYEEMKREAITSTLGKKESQGKITFEQTGFDLYVIPDKGEPRKVQQVTKEVVDFMDYYLPSKFTASGHKVYTVNGITLGFTQKKKEGSNV